MPGLKEIRSRIGTVKTTRQVTNAMKMVSAAKLKKAQDVVSSFTPYARKLSDIAATVIPRDEETAGSEYSMPREIKNVLIVLVTSNKGLCGAFNSKITNEAVSWVKSNYTKEWKEGGVHFFTIGKYGERLLKNHKMTVVGSCHDLTDHPTFQKASEVARQLENGFLNKHYDKVELIYNEFVTAAQYRQNREVFLPLTLPVTGKINPENVLFEPSREEITGKIIPMLLQSLFYKAIVVSGAAEHGARMTAMHQATDNATDLINELTLQYNKARQAAITKEILEITGGAEAQRNQ